MQKEKKKKLCRYLFTFIGTSKYYMNIFQDGFVLIKNELFNKLYRIPI